MRSVQYENSLVKYFDEVSCYGRSPPAPPSFWQDCQASEVKTHKSSKQVKRGKETDGLGGTYGSFIKDEQNLQLWLVDQDDGAAPATPLSILL